MVAGRSLIVYVLRFELTDGLGVKQDFLTLPGQDTIVRLSIALMESVGPIRKEGVWCPL